MRHHCIPPTSCDCSQLRFHWLLQLTMLRPTNCVIIITVILTMITVWVSACERWLVWDIRHCFWQTPQKSLTAFEITDIVVEQNPVIGKCTHPLSGNWPAQLTSSQTTADHHVCWLYAYYTTEACMSSVVAMLAVKCLNELPCPHVLLYMYLCSEPVLSCFSLYYTIIKLCYCCVYSVSSFWLFLCWFCYFC